MTSNSQSSSSSTSTMLYDFPSCSKPRKPLPRIPTVALKRRKSSSLDMYPPTFSEVSCTRELPQVGAKSCHSSIPLCRKTSQSTVSPTHSSLSPSSRGYPFPPRRPIRRSLYASEQVLGLENTARLGPTSPITYPSSSPQMAPSTGQARVPVQGHSAAQSAVPVQFPVLAPLKNFLHYTMRTVYSELTHLRSSCLSVLGVEQQQHFLKMERVRETVREDAGGRENFPASSGGWIGKRPREEEVSPISGRESCFPPSRPEYSPTIQSSVPEPGSYQYPRDPALLTPAMAIPELSPNFVSSTSRRSSLQFHDDDFRLLYPYDSDEDDKPFPPLKKRRLFVSSSLEDLEVTSLVEDCKLKASATVAPNNDDEYGERDMDLESDSDVDSVCFFEVTQSELLDELTLKQEEAESDNGDVELTGTPSTSCTITT